MAKRKIRKHYDDEFKRDAVNHWIKSGKTAKQTADALGIAEANLHRWKEKYLTEEGGPQQEALKVENERLRRENLELRQEREILKKSVAIFLKPQR